MKNVEKQSIVKLIIVRFRKLGNSIYQKWNNGQTMIVQNQIFKGDLILHVRSRGFQFCLFSYMMMHNNRQLLSDRRGIPKTFHLRHGGIAFRILTINLNEKLKSTKIIFNYWFYSFWSKILCKSVPAHNFFRWKNQLCIIFLHFQKNLFVKKLLKLMIRNCWFFFF